MVNFECSRIKTSCNSRIELEELIRELQNLLYPLSEIEIAWVELGVKRLELFDQGKTESISGEEAFRRAREALSKN